MEVGHGTEFEAVTVTGAAVTVAVLVEVTGCAVTVAVEVTGGCNTGLVVVVVEVVVEVTGGAVTVVVTVEGVGTVYNSSNSEGNYSGEVYNSSCAIIKFVARLILISLH